MTGDVAIIDGPQAGQEYSSLKTVGVETAVAPQKQSHSAQAVT